MEPAPDPMATLLADLRRGAPGAADEVFRRCYAELRRIAGGLFRSQRAAHTLEPTALVHEAYVKIVGAARPADVTDRAHFLCLAARAMRQILVNHARDRAAAKRGGGRRRERLTVADPEAPRGPTDVIDLDEALDVLAALDARQARIAELRLFGGLTTAEIAAVVGVAPRTVELDWRLARAWLAGRFGEGPDVPRTDPAAP